MVPTLALRCALDRACDDSANILPGNTHNTLRDTRGTRIENKTTSVRAWDIHQPAINVYSTEPAENTMCVSTQQNTRDPCSRSGKMLAERIPNDNWRNGLALMAWSRCCRKHRYALEHTGPLAEGNRTNTHPPTTAADANIDVHARRAHFWPSVGERRESARAASKRWWDFHCQESRKHAGTWCVEPG